jgi:hypothetical protein
MLCGILVLVCGRRCGALRRASNLYPDGGRSHWRRSRRLCSRSDRRLVDLGLSCIPLVGEPVGPKVEPKRGYLFCAYWYLRRRRNNCILPALPKRRSTLVCSRDSGGWRGDHGCGWHLVFWRSAILAANRRHCICHHWFVFAAQVKIAAHNVIFTRRIQTLRVNAESFDLITANFRLFPGLKFFGRGDPLNSTLTHAYDVSSDLGGLSAVVSDIQQGKAELRM